jgi:hypothetical protein
MNIAIIENDVVINVILVDSLEIASQLTELEILDVTNLKIGVNYFRENNEWYPPKPNPTDVWHQHGKRWITLQYLEETGGLGILSPEEIEELEKDTRSKFPDLGL